MVRILWFSRKNHSPNMFRRVVVPGFRMNTAIARTTPASSSTTGNLRPATFWMLIVSRPEVQSRTVPGPPPPRGAAPRPAMVNSVSTRRTVESRIALSRNHPLRFADLPVVDFQAQRHHGRRAAFFEETEVIGCSLLVTQLRVFESLYCLSHGIVGRRSIVDGNNLIDIEAQPLHRFVKMHEIGKAGGWG